MSLLDRKNFLYEEDDSNYEEYKLPKLVTTKPEVIPIKKSLAISTALHPGVVLLIWLITVALALMGIHLFTFHKPDAKLKKDIEFVLVDKEAMPRNMKTKNRADMNSRSGGINDPKRKVSMPSPAPQKSVKPSSAANSANKLIKKQQQAAQQKAAQQKAKPKAQQTPVKSAQPVTTNKPSPAKPAPPTARPSAKPVAAPAVAVKPTTPFAIPKPANAPSGKSLATGPIGGTSAPTGTSKGGTGSGSATGSRTGVPAPSLAPGKGGSSSLGRTGSGTKGGTGNIGNPGGGGGAPGIDALREPDFGPYMRELQRRIKMNWDPPKGNESKRVVLLFKIAKDGRLLSCRVNKSSGLPSADQAALKAVELTAPFRPLPADFRGQSIDIQFTFDYNVFNASRY